MADDPVNTARDDAGFAGIRPKLRPSESFPPISAGRSTKSRRSALRREGIAATGRTSGGPSIESVGQHARAQAAVDGDRRPSKQRHHDDEQLAVTSISRRCVRSRKNPGRSESSSERTARRARHAPRVAEYPQSSARPAERLAQPPLIVALRVMLAPAGFMFDSLGSGFFEEVAAARGIEQLARDDRSAPGTGRCPRLARPDRAGGRRASATCAACSTSDRGIPPCTESNGSRASGSSTRRCCSTGRLSGCLRESCTDAAQERFVGERLRLEVRREHDEDVERHLELPPGVQRQVVDAALERHDPRFSRSRGGMR